MKFKRNIVDYLSRYVYIRNFIRRFYYSIISYEDDRILHPDTEIVSRSEGFAKNNYLHFEAVKKIGSLLLVENCVEELHRFGGPNDGGYVMAEPKSRNVAIISLGIGKDVSWDVSMSKYARVIHLYDHTVVDIPEKIPSGIHFKQKIGAKSSPDSISLADCFERLPRAEEYILKIDIEGSEWEVLDEATLDLLDEFSQIVIEFHNLHTYLETLQISKAVNVLAKLRKNHLVVNFHANNFGDFKIIGNHPVPDIFEVSYLNRKSTIIKNEQDVVAELNAPNSTSIPEIVLKFPY